MAGLIFAVWGAVRLGSGAETYFSTPVMGEITKLEIKIEKLKSRGKHGTVSKKYETLLYRPVITYKYEVNGKEYSAEETFTLYNEKEDAENKLSQYSGKKVVDVYYNKDNPEISTLFPGKFILGGILMIIGGIVGIFLGAKLRITQ